MNVTGVVRLVVETDLVENKARYIFKKKSCCCRVLMNQMDREREMVPSGQ